MVDGLIPMCKRNKRTSIMIRMYIEMDVDDDNY
jgi:hypothetical protein